MGVEKIEDDLPTRTRRASASAARPELSGRPIGMSIATTETGTLSSTRSTSSVMVRATKTCARRSVSSRTPTHPPGQASTPRTGAGGTSGSGRGATGAGPAGRGREPGLPLAAEGGLDALQHDLGHRREGGDRPPPHVRGLVVGHVGLALDPGAGEGEVEVGRAVAVGVHDLGVGAGRGEPVDADPHAGLLRHLTRRRHRRLLAGVDDPGDRRPPAVVRPLDQQHLVAAAYDRGDGREPQRVVAADPGPDRDDEVGDRAHRGLTR